MDPNYVNVDDGGAACQSKQGRRRDKHDADRRMHAATHFIPGHLWRDHKESVGSYRSHAFSPGGDSTVGACR